MGRQLTPDVTPYEAVQASAIALDKPDGCEPISSTSAIGLSGNQGKMVRDRGID